MNRLLTAAALAALCACGTTTNANKDGIADGIRTPNDTTVVAPSNPIGTVSGVVATTRFAGLEGATVTLVLGGKGDGTKTTFAATTDVDGNFSFKGLPAGATGQVLATKSGFATARVSVTVPAAAGNFPINDGNGDVGVLLLAELNSTVKFSVYGSNGRPAKGAKAVLEVSPVAIVSSSYSTYGAGQGALTLEATVDDVGSLSFANVPSPAEMARIGGLLPYSLYVAAWDEDGDGRLESLGTSAQYSGTTLFTNPMQVLTLPDARSSAALAILSSNLNSLTAVTTNSSLPYRNQLRAADPISVVFNQPIADKTLLSVKVVGEDCATSVAVKVEQKAPNLLTISPVTTWNVGQEFHVAIRATGLDLGPTTSFVGFFFVIDPTAPRPLGTTASFQAKKAAGNTNAAQLQPGDDLYVVFDTPTTLIGTLNPRVFANFDLNANGTIGTMSDQSVGEFGSPFSSGYTIAVSEQSFVTDVSTFTCRANTYGSRWRVSSTFPVPAGGVDSGKQLKVTVPKDNSGTAGFQTAWGQVFSGDIAGTLTIIP